MNELILDLEEQIKNCLSCNEDPDFKSWQDEIGVIITVNDAKQIIDILQQKDPADRCVCPSDFRGSCSFWRPENKCIWNVGWTKK